MTLDLLEYKEDRRFKCDSFFQRWSCVDPAHRVSFPTRHLPVSLSSRFTKFYEPGVRWRFRTGRLRHRMSCHDSAAIRIRAPTRTAACLPCYVRERWYSRTRIPSGIGEDERLRRHTRIPGRKLWYIREMIGIPIERRISRLARFVMKLVIRRNIFSKAYFFFLEDKR